MPQPCKWVKSTDEILASVRRFRLKVNGFDVSEEARCKPVSRVSTQISICSFAAVDFKN